MEDVDKIIDKALGVVSDVKEEKKKPVIINRPKENDDIDSDYKYQRENLYNLIERGQDAVEGVLDIARESDHPRAYEVAGNVIKQVADVTEKLIDLQNKMKKLKDEPTSTAPKNVTNALFVGSTADLQKMIKKKND